MEITIETTINAPIERVWSARITPDDIKQWNFASEDWCCPDAKVDFREGGTFNLRMEARDGSMGFNLEGKYTAIDEHKSIDYALADDRKVTVKFIGSGEGVLVTETFEAEDVHSAEQQRQGWQSILDNFKKHVESSNT
ncbi:MAG: SRPBCC family protein [Acidiferrobacterales bacterium]